MTPIITALTLFVLVAASLGGLLLALFLPQLSENPRIRRRILALGATNGSGHPESEKTAGVARQVRRSVEDTLREIEQKGRLRQSWRPRSSLQGRLREADLDVTPTTYFLISAATGLLVVALLVLGLGLGQLASLGLGLVSGLWLPHAYVARRIKQRRKAFTTGFPDAVDIIVRGIRSGIPLSDCLQIVASEAETPVRQEFRATVEDLAMGLAVDDAVQRMSDRVALEEARFFSIVITIQNRTGGNLSEALANLSIVLRDRAKMRARIRAMSSEAKTSAGIIGSLPPVVCFFVFLTSPDYVGLLFSTVAGNAVLVGSGIWMLFGVGIMRQMINFDF